MSALNPQQRLFAHEYVRQNGNATEAAKAAGYSKKTAYSQGGRLLRHVEVKRLITELQAKQLAKVDASAERVKQELARIAFVDIGEAFTEDGALRPLHEMPEDVRRVVSAVDVEALFEGRGEEREQVGTVRKLRLWSKTEALNLLAKHHGMLRDVVESTVRHELGDVSDEEVETLAMLRHQVRAKEPPCPTTTTPPTPPAPPSSES